MFYLWDVIYTVYKDMKKQQNATPIHVITQLYFLEAKRPDSQKFCQDYLLDWSLDWFKSNKVRWNEVSQHCKHFKI